MNQFTVCVCTRNRPDDLHTALNSIRASSIMVSQIVVSDDSTDDRTRLLVSQQHPDVDFVEGPRKGLSANRNAALRMVRGSHVLFIDDDATLGAHFFATVLPLIDALALDAREKTIVSGFESNHGKLIHPNEQSFLGYLNRPYKAGDKISTSVINATVFPMRLFQDIGFDTNLIYGYDEVDITTRAAALGYRIILCPEAQNSHFPSAVNRDLYQAHIEASRLYVTFKRYVFTDRTYARAIGFGLTAPLHLAASILKHHGIAGTSPWLKTLAEAVGYTLRFLRERPDRAVLYREVQPYLQGQSDTALPAI